MTNRLILFKNSGFYGEEKTEKLKHDRYKLTLSCLNCLISFILRKQSFSNEMARYKNGESMNTVKKSIFIFGKSGRMGQEVAKIVKQSPFLSLAGGLSRKEKPALDSSPDLVIDFSLPQAFSELLAFMEKHGSPLVSGTTGFDKSQMTKLHSLGRKVPVFWSANMSFGIYLMTKLTETLAKYKKFYKYQIEETHHAHKKDKPSGTALVLEKTALGFTDLQPTLSHRKPEVFGIHRFIARSENEQLEIRHEALNRKLFAQGAVDVGKWLIQQPAGFYRMKDFFKSLEKNLT